VTVTSRCGTPGHRGSAVTLNNVGDTTGSTAAAPLPSSGQGNTGRTDEPLVGQLLDGRYRVESRIARGGMATVYAATDMRLERLVALKVMHPSFAEDPEFVGRFVREARSAARLSDPHVVAVFDQGETASGVVYLVMEFVDGRTLRDIIREQGRLTPSQALTILEPVAEALAAAHRAGLIHRDIKPENVLVDDRGRVKVADFGLARAVTPSTTSAATQGLLIGTVAYLSPEQVESGSATARSDVYGAGVLLFELVTGRVPFSGETPLAVAYKHVNHDVPLPSEVVPGIPAQVDALVERATARDASERFADGAALLAAIRTARTVLPAPTPLSQADTVIVDRSAGAAAVGGVVIDNATRQNTAVLPAPSEASDVAADDEPPGPPRKRRGRRWFFRLLLLIVVAALAVGGYLIWHQLQQVAVPDVVNRTPQQASTLLTRSGLKLAIAGQTFSETIAPGRVVSTSPLAGAKASKGATINALISKGPERHAVPSVKGLTPVAATAALQAQHLNVGVTSYAYDDVVTKGLVIRTNPVQGTPLRRNAAVDLVVSKGPAPVPMPNVVGKTQAQATALLAANGLTVATVTKTYSSTVLANVVMSATPHAGATVFRGSTVALVVSKGPPPVTVPGVRDLPVAQAVRELESRGLHVALTYPFGSAVLGRVLAQSPSAGSVVPRGTTVTLRVV